MKCKLKHLISLFLCCLILLSPFTAFGSVVTPSKNLRFEYIYNYGDGSDIGIVSTSDLPYEQTIKRPQGLLQNVYINLNVAIDFTAKDEFIFDMLLYENGRYSDLSATLKFTNTSGGTWTRDCTYSNGHIKHESTIYNTVSVTSVVLELSNFEYNSSLNLDSNTYFKVTSCKYQIETENSSFFGNVIEWFKKIGEWFSDLKIAMSGFFDGLGDRISGFFTNLGNSIKERFTDLKNNLKSFFDDVGDWFSTLGDKISGFFDKLWNRIWWGNEEGEAAYQKPVINNKMNDIISTLQDYQTKLKGTIDTIDTASDDVSEYISTGTSLVNGIVGVAGAGFTALIVFGIVFVLVRKVVGR